ncbi:MAG TPA: PadR family transcriptional regulator [Symbiobacteriaceae bacterium]
MHHLPVKHGILGILGGRPRHGYELKTEFDLLTGGLWDLNVGQIYSTLERMLKDGLVSLEEEAGSGEDRKVYRLTDSGAGELAAWLDRLPLKARPMRDEVFVRLGLLLERDTGAALDLIASQRRIYHLQMAGLTRQKIGLGRLTGPDRFRRGLLLDAALLHTEADLKWLEICEAKLQGGGIRE